MKSSREFQGFCFDNTNFVAMAKHTKLAIYSSDDLNFI